MARGRAIFRRSSLLLAPAVVFLLIFFVAPLVRVVELSLFSPGFTLRFYEAAVTSPVYVRVLLNTLHLGLLVTVGCLLLGYPIAFLLATTTERSRRALLILIVLPYFTSILVRSYSWLVILGRHGLLNEMLLATGMIREPLKLIYNTPGVLIAMIHILLPVMIFALFGQMRGIDFRLARTSESLGANRAQTFFRIVLPLSLPGIVAGCLLVFVFSIGFYITPALLGGLQDTILPMLIATQISELLNWGMGSALSVLLLLVTLTLFGAFSIFSGTGKDPAGAHGQAVKAPIARKAGRFPLIIACLPILEEFLVLAARALGPAARGRRLLYVAAFAILSFLLAPIVLIFPVSFTNSLYLQFPPQGFSLRWYQSVFASSVWGTAAWLSLRVALATACLALVLGTTAGLAFARSRSRAMSILYGFVLAPLVVPVIVTAVALYAFFADLGLVGTYWALVLGHLIGAVPLVMVLMKAALGDVDLSLERAAASLGASAPRAFLQITLPLVRPTLLVAAFFAFMHSFDEVVISTFVGSINAETLSKKMWEGVRLEIKPDLAAISALLIVLTATGLLVASLVGGKRGAIPVGMR